MSYARIDDLLPHHRKVVAAGKDGPTVFGYYVASVCYAQRHFTDGVIHQADLPLLIPGAPRPPRRILQLLESLHLWDPLPDGTGWVVHDYLDWNDSAADRRAKLAKDAARKRGSFHSDIHQESARNPSGIRTDSVRTSSPLLSAPLHSTPLRSAGGGAEGGARPPEPAEATRSDPGLSPAGSESDQDRRCLVCGEQYLGGPKCPKRAQHGKTPESKAEPAPPARADAIAASILPSGVGP